MKVGFIGLGNMGLPMAGNLLRAGFELEVYNRTAAKAEPLVAAGARLVASPADLAATTDIVLICVADAAASKAVFLGDRGVLESARPGQIFVDHGTVDIDTARQLHAAAEAVGARFLDAPISGGPDGAAAATLTIMVGGTKEGFAAALPVFRALGENIVHLGAVGTGTAAKLANQLLVGVHTVAACEALLLGARAGIDPQELAGVLMSAWGASRMLERIAPIVAERRFRPSGVPLRILAKDLAIIVELAAAMDLDLAAARQAESTHRRAIDRGMAEADLAAIFELLEND